MADQLKRLNTFIAASTLRSVKVFAAENELALGPAVEILLSRGLQGGVGDEPSYVAPLVVSEEVHEAAAKTADKLLAETFKVPSPDTIVRCERCGAELPESAKAIHEQNCATAQQGYWDRTNFRS